MSSLILRPCQGRRLPRVIVLFRSAHQFRLGWRIGMKRLVPIPCACAEPLNNAEETGIGYQVVSVQLKDERVSNPAVLTEASTIKVRATNDIPFTPTAL